MKIDADKEDETHQKLILTNKHFMFFGSDGELLWIVEPQKMKQCVLSVHDETDVVLTNDHHIKM